MLLLAHSIIGWVPLKASQVGREDKRRKLFSEKGWGVAVLWLSIQLMFVKHYGQKEILQKPINSGVHRCSGALSPLEDLTTGC